MIISASRRTDIPAYYSEWFCNRIKEGFVLVRNPMNFRQVSRISLAPDVVDGIVFWTKNPMPMLDRLSELKDYMYYFQFTVTPYGTDIEPNVPPKKDVILPAFKRLADTIGPDRVILRYDPILISKKYTEEYHIQAFGEIIRELHLYTRKVTISFIDEDYRTVRRNMSELALMSFPPAAQIELSAQLAKIAHSYGLTIDTCAEEIELEQFGIGRAGCIDGKLFEKLLGCGLHVEKDRNQRTECGCVSSIDIGMYNTCRTGCLYCYANYSGNVVDENFSKHSPRSPFILGEVGEADKITERKMTSFRDTQTRLAAPCELS